MSVNHLTGNVNAIDSRDRLMEAEAERIDLLAGDPTTWPTSQLLDGDRWMLGPEPATTVGIADGREQALRFAAGNFEPPPSTPRQGRVSECLLSFRDRFTAMLEATGEFPLATIQMCDGDALVFIVEDPAQRCDFEIGVSRA